MSIDIDKEKIEQAVDKATSKWGVWVKYLIGAIIGALVASGAIAVTSCESFKDYKGGEFYLETSNGVISSGNGTFIIQKKK